MAGNEFGYSLSLYRAGAAANFGYVLVVGAPGANTAYVFTNNPTVNLWIQNSILTAPSSVSLDAASRFGQAVAVNEDIIMVGCPGSADSSGLVASFIAQNKSGQTPPVQWSQQAVVSVIRILLCIFNVLTGTMSCF